MLEQLEALAVIHVVRMHRHRIQFKHVDPEHVDECKQHFQPRSMRISRSGMRVQGTNEQHYERPLLRMSSRNLVRRARSTKPRMMPRFTSKRRTLQSSRTRFGS